jgi:formate hydrogenlyase subunit 3/multisubunit Na+/H+ antiporter MnhD subunit
MMKGLSSQYWFSRFLLVALLALVMVALGAPIWMVLLVLALSMAALLLLVRSGKYAIRPESDLLPLRRDERGEDINRRASTYGFVVVMVLLGAAILLYTIFPGSPLARRITPLDAMQLIIAAGLITRVLSEVLLRQRM